MYLIQMYYSEIIAISNSQYHSHLSKVLYEAGNLETRSIFLPTTAFFIILAWDPSPFRDEVNRDKFEGMIFTVFSDVMHVHERKWFRISFSSMTVMSLSPFINFTLSCKLDVIAPAVWIHGDPTTFWTWLGCQSEQKNLKLTTSDLQCQVYFSYGYIWSCQMLSPSFRFPL